MKPLKRQSLKGPGRCIFCGGLGLTKEHVYGRWLRKFIPVVSPRITHRVQHFDPGKLHKPVPIKRGKLDRPGDIVSQQLRVVCRACNEGWMRKLQERARPILLPLIQGEWAQLSTEQSRTLASWAALFTMVNEFSDPKAAAVSLDQRRAFWRDQTPPGPWSIWIGRYKDRSPHNNCEWNRHVLRFALAPLQVGLPNYVDVHTSSFTLVNVFFHVFGATTHITLDDISTLSRRYDVASGPLSLFPSLRLPRPTIF